MSSLQYLNFSHRELPIQQLTPIAEALQNHPSLQEFVLSDTHIKDLNTNTQVREEFTKALEQLIKNIPSLKRLNLSRTYLGDTIAESLAKHLKENTTLHHLDISRTFIESEGAKAIGNACKDKDSLRYLNIGNNNIRDKAIKEIVEALKNTPLHHLDIHFTRTGPEGAAAIAQLLKSNTSLTHLNLHTNPDIKDNDLEKILKALKDNTTLKSLNLLNSHGSRLHMELKSLPIFLRRIQR